MKTWYLLSPCPGLILALCLLSNLSGDPTGPGPLRCTSGAPPRALRGGPLGPLGPLGPPGPLPGAPPPGLRAPLCPCCCCWNLWPDTIQQPRASNKHTRKFIWKYYIKTKITDGLFRSVPSPQTRASLSFLRIFCGRGYLMPFYDGNQIKKICRTAMLSVSE